MWANPRLVNYRSRAYQLLEPDVVAAGRLHRPVVVWQSNDSRVIIGSCCNTGDMESHHLLLRLLTFFYVQATGFWPIDMRSRRHFRCAQVWIGRVRGTCSIQRESKEKRHCLECNVKDEPRNNGPKDDMLCASAAISSEIAS